MLKTAWLMDTVGNKGAHTEIQAIKIAVPAMAEWVLDKAIQAHGAGGVSQDFPLAALWAAARSLRLADGPDEVHKRSLAHRELKKYASKLDTRAYGNVEETRMSEKVAVVTGAARGIGAATAAELAADGFAVAVLDLEEAACTDTVERITAAGGRALGGRRGRVRLRPRCSAAVDRIAGRARPAGRCWSTTPA